MNTELQTFLARLAGVVTLALVPVVITAFVSMPFSLSRHPGEPALTAQADSRHMT